MCPLYACYFDLKIFITFVSSGDMEMQNFLASFGGKFYRTFSIQNYI